MACARALGRGGGGGGGGSGAARGEAEAARAEWEALEGCQERLWKLKGHLVSPLLDANSTQEDAAHENITGLRRNQMNPNHTLKPKVTEPNPALPEMTLLSPRSDTGPAPPAWGTGHGPWATGAELDLGPAPPAAARLPPPPPPPLGGRTGLDRLREGGQGPPGQSPVAAVPRLPPPGPAAAAAADLLPPPRGSPHEWGQFQTEEAANSLSLLSPVGSFRQMESAPPSSVGGPWTAAMTSPTTIPKGTSSAIDQEKRRDSMAMPPHGADGWSPVSGAQRLADIYSLSPVSGARHGAVPVPFANDSLKEKHTTPYGSLTKNGSGVHTLTSRASLATSKDYGILAVSKGNPEPAQKSPHSDDDADAASLSELSRALQQSFRGTPSPSVEKKPHSQSGQQGGSSNDASLAPSCSPSSPLIKAYSPSASNIFEASEVHMLNPGPVHKHNLASQANQATTITDWNRPSGWIGTEDGRTIQQDGLVEVKSFIEEDSSCDEDDKAHDGDTGANKKKSMSDLDPSVRPGHVDTKENLQDLNCKKSETQGEHSAGSANKSQQQQASEGPGVGRTSRSSRQVSALSLDDITDDKLDRMLAFGSLGDTPRPSLIPSIKVPAASGPSSPIVRADDGEQLTDVTSQPEKLIAGTCQGKMEDQPSDREEISPVPSSPASILRKPGTPNKILLQKQVSFERLSSGTASSDIFAEQSAQEVEVLKSSFGPASANLNFDDFNGATHSAFTSLQNTAQQYASEHNYTTLQSQKQSTSVFPENAPSPDVHDLIPEPNTNEALFPAQQIENNGFHLENTPTRVVASSSSERIKGQLPFLSEDQRAMNSSELVPDNLEGSFLGLFPSAPKAPGVFGLNAASLRDVAGIKNSQRSQTGMASGGINVLRPEEEKLLWDLVPSGGLGASRCPGPAQHKCTPLCEYFSALSNMDFMSPDEDVFDNEGVPQDDLFPTTPPDDYYTRTPDKDHESTNSMYLDGVAEKSPQRDVLTELPRYLQPKSDQNSQPVPDYLQPKRVSSSLEYDSHRHKRQQEQNDWSTFSNRCRNNPRLSGFSGTVPPRIAQQIYRNYPFGSTTQEPIAKPIGLPETSLDEDRLAPKPPRPRKETAFELSRGQHLIRIQGHSRTGIKSHPGKNNFRLRDRVYDYWLSQEAEPQRDVAKMHYQS